MSLQNDNKNNELEKELDKLTESESAAGEELSAAAERRKKSRKLKYGAIATVITILVLVGVIVINVIVGILSDKYPLSVDLTKNQAFNLTSDSIDFLNGLEKDVQIYILNDESSFKNGGEYFTQANNVINQYAKHSGHIKVEYVSLDKNPTFSSKYPNASLSTSGILVTCGDEYKSLTVNDLFEIESSMYGQYITASKAEQAMTSALLNVTSDTKVKISFLTGYSEEDSSAFKSLLQSNGYEVVEQNIMTEDIDKEAKLAVIFAPARDYDETALNKLDEFMSNDEQYGKNIVYVANSTEQSAPKTNLNSFLKEWKVQVGEGLVFESNTQRILSSQQPSPYFALNDYVDEEFQKGVKTTTSPVIVPLSCPITVEDTDAVKTLIEYSETSGIVPNNAPTDWKPSQSDINGPNPAVVVSTQSKSAGGELVDSNVAVIGSAVALGAEALSTNGFNNSAYFINMFNILCDREESITIESKTVGGEQMVITAQQANVWGAVFIYVLPILVLALGIVIWIRRRNR